MAKNKILAELEDVVTMASIDTAVADKVIGKKPESFEDKLKALDDVCTKLNTEFKTTHSLIRMGEKVGKPIPSIVTNLPSVDKKLLQCGGIPRGRIIEIFGPESGGKTTVCLHIIAEEQKTGELAAFIDAEHALDPTWASKCGVDVENLFVSQPDSGEQALETVEALVRSRAVSIIVVDSVAALVPQAELDGEMGESHMGLQARLMGQAMRKLRAICNQTGVTVIFINQIREKIGVMFGSPETTPGGRAIKFYSSVRIDCRRKEVIKDGDQAVGHVVKLKAVKNKCGAPHKEVDVDLMYTGGLNSVKDWIKYAIEQGVIEQKGAWYSFNGEKVGQGMDNVVESLKNNSGAFTAIRAALDKAS